MHDKPIDFKVVDDPAELGHCWFCLARVEVGFVGHPLTQQFPDSARSWFADAIVLGGLYDEQKQEPKPDARPCICEACIVQVYGALMENRVGEDECLGSTPEEPVFPAAIYNALARNVVGQSRALRAMSIAVDQHHLRIAELGAEVLEDDTGHDEFSDVVVGKSNVLLIGPTGTGKTLIGRLAAGYLGVPYVEVSAANVSSTGYVGGDAEGCLKELYYAAGGELLLAERGIVILDEVDKINKKGGSDGADVNGSGAQHAFLKLIEGAKVPIKVRVPGEHHDREIMFDTTNVLFVACGAFPGLEKIIERRITKNSIGFLGERKGKASTAELLCQVETDDLHAFGFIHEFLGRFPVVETLDELTTDELRAVLTEPRSAIVRQYQKMFNKRGIELFVRPEVLNAIAEAAKRQKKGARGLRGALENCLRSALFAAPGMKHADPTLAKVIITEKTFAGGEPKYVHRREVLGKAALVE